MTWLGSLVREAVSPPIRTELALGKKLPGGRQYTRTRKSAASRSWKRALPCCQHLIGGSHNSDIAAILP